MIRDLAAMSWTDVEAALALRLPALLPVGACEAHGAHLPLTVDTDLAGGVARRLAQATGAFLLPALPYGETWGAEGWPGTLSLAPDTLRAAVLDLGRGLLRQGVPALILVNGHFGNRPPLDLAARALAAEGLPVLVLDHPGLDRLAAEVCDALPPPPGYLHADEAETSMMLALRPEAVRMDRAAPGEPVMPPTWGAEPMLLRALVPDAVVGDPRPATAAKGERLVDGVVAEAIGLLDAFLARHGLPAGPWPR